jgi:DNA-binding MarR family transcriptional regulator
VNADRQTLAVLETVEKSSEATQRQIASTTGLSLGLVNAIVKDLAKRGMIKMSQVPRRRLLYYLTPQGFAEKTALIFRVLRTVQSDYQQIRSQLHAQARAMKEAGVKELVLRGDPFLLEIGCICCLELGLRVKALFSDNEHRVGDNVCGHILASASEVPANVRVWEVQYTSLGMVRDHVVERSRREFAEGAQQI